MNPSTWYFTLLFLVASGEQSSSTCEVFTKIRSSVIKSNHSYEDSEFLTCLAGLHEFNPAYFLYSNDSIDDESLFGIFGFNSERWHQCTNVTSLVLKDDDITDNVACYLYLRKLYRVTKPSIAEKLCSDINKQLKSTFFDVKYKTVKCENRSVHVPSYRLKRLYRLYSQKRATNELNSILNYEHFSANVTYYDSYVYAHFFLEKWWRLLKKVKKSLIILTKRPVRLLVALVIIIFLLLTLMRCLKMAGKCCIDKMARWKQRVKEAGFLEIR